MDPRFTVYTSTPQGMAELLHGADLVYIHLHPSLDLSQVIPAAIRLLHRRGNLLLLGRLTQLCQASRHLPEGMPAMELVVPISPPIFTEQPPALAHRAALLAWMDAAHISRVPGKLWGGRYLGGTTLVNPSPREPVPLTNREIEAATMTLLRTSLILPLVPVSQLALLVERYSEEGGLVVSMGFQKEWFALTAYLLGRSAALPAATLEEANALQPIPELYTAELAALKRRGRAASRTATQEPAREPFRASGSEGAAESPPR